LPEKCYGCTDPTAHGNGKDGENSTWEEHGETRMEKAKRLIREDVHPEIKALMLMDILDTEISPESRLLSYSLLAIARGTEDSDSQPIADALESIASELGSLTQAIDNQITLMESSRNLRSSL